MRFLADAGISPRTVEFLRQAGHDALHVRELGLQRAPDRALVERARADERVILVIERTQGEILDWPNRVRENPIFASLPLLNLDHPIFSRSDEVLNRFSVVQ